MSFEAQTIQVTGQSFPAVAVSSREVDRPLPCWRSSLGQVLSPKQPIPSSESLCEPLIAFEIHSLARNGAWGRKGGEVKLVGLR